MTKLLTTLLLSLPLSTLAGPMNLSRDEITGILLSNVYPLFDGDDGSECRVTLSKLETISETASVLKVRVTGMRDITQHGCAPEFVNCAVAITRGKNSNDWGTEFLCD